LLLTSYIVLTAIRCPSQYAHFPYTTLFRSVDESRICLVTESASTRDAPDHVLELLLVGQTHCVGDHTRRRLDSVLGERLAGVALDRKSTRLNSSHGSISYAVFCLKKKTLKH